MYIPCKVVLERRKTRSYLVIVKSICIDAFDNLELMKEIAQTIEDEFIGWKVRYIGSKKKQFDI